MPKGTITDIQSRDVTVKKGPKAGRTMTAWDVYIDHTKFGAGFKKPMGFDVGDSVEYDYSTDTYGHQLMNARKVEAGNGSVPGTLTPTGNQGKRNTVFPVPVDHGDRSIIRQNSLTNARELMCTLLSKVPIDEKKMKGHPFLDKDAQGALDEMAEEIIRIAYKFEEYSAGDRERRAADELTKNKG